MKRFHVHIAVKDLLASVEFYSKLFGAGPAKQQLDYAKWMLDEPRVNFAISARGHEAGVNHFGFQAETPEELAALRERAEAAAGGAVLDQSEAACCYAKSEKHWTVDPQGLAWEHFRTMADAETFGQDVATQEGACCIPVRGVATTEAAAGAACCISNEAMAKAGACCS